jgi:hypothetical protein
MHSAPATAILEIISDIGMFSCHLQRNALHLSVAKINHYSYIEIGKQTSSLGSLGWKETISDCTELALQLFQVAHGFAT